MLNRCLLIFLTVFLLVGTSSCEDTLDNLATNVIGSEFVLGADTLYLSYTQDMAQRMYYANDTLMLGEYFDSRYGMVKAEVLVEILSSNDTIPKERKINNGYWENPTYQGLELVINNTILKSVGNAPMKISVYQKNDTLTVKEKYYSDIDINTYCKKDILLAEKWVMGDSLISITSDALTQLGEDLFKIGIESPADLRDSQKFRGEIFKGLYLTTSGSKNLLINLLDNEEGTYLALRLVYQYEDFIPNENVEEKDLPKEKLKSALYFSAFTYSPKAQKITNTIDVNALNNADEGKFGYISSPAGLQAKIYMDLPRIDEKLEAFKQNEGVTANINLNKAILTLKVKEDDNTTLPMSANLLLIKKDVLINSEDNSKGFFEAGNFSDGQSSFLGTRKGNQYLFDIARYIQQQKNDNKMDIVEEMIVVPVGYNSAEKIDLSALRFYNDSIQVELIYNVLNNIN